MTEEQKKKYDAILIFGPPYIGKGTQAKLLGKNEKYLHFSSGDMLRGLRDNPEMADSEIGKKVKELIDHGHYAPDDLTMELFKKTLQEYEKSGRYDPSKQILILDGIPRTPPQVDLINPYIEVSKILYLISTDNDILIGRAKKRADIEGRADDADESIIRSRLETYKKETEAIIEKYDSSLIEEVDGTGTIEEVDAEVKKRMQAW